MNDYITGIDDVIERNAIIIDFTNNLNGEKLLDFLIDSNTCVLNGRNFVKNDFTSVSVKGCSVVDWCIIQQEYLQMFTEFSVIRSTELMSRVTFKDNFLPSSIT
jgi:hypothetical protein